MFQSFPVTVGFSLFISYTKWRVERVHLDSYTLQFFAVFWCANIDILKQVFFSQSYLDTLFIILRGMKKFEEIVQSKILIHSLLLLHYHFLNYK